MYIYSESFSPNLEIIVELFCLNDKTKMKRLIAKKVLLI